MIVHKINLLLFPIPVGLLVAFTTAQACPFFRSAVSAMATWLPGSLVISYAVQNVTKISKAAVVLSMIHSISLYT